MNLDVLNREAKAFAVRAETSAELQAHQSDHERRVGRASRLLVPAQIPMLTIDDLRELFFDSDAMGFWSNKEYELNRRIQQNGLEGLRQSLADVMERAERGLTVEDLKHIAALNGIGALLTTELLSYRFPDRYWTFSENVTFAALLELGVDLKGQMPRGQKSWPYFYLALEPHIAAIRQALFQAGLKQVDNLAVDIFLWELRRLAQIKEKTERTPSAQVDSAASPDDVARVAATLSRLIPDPTARRTALDVLAQYIEQAHAVNPAAWSVSVFRNVARLNVGNTEAYIISENSVHAVLDGASLSKTDKDRLREAGGLQRASYRYAKTPMSLYLEPSDLAPVTDVVAKGIPALVDQLGRRFKISPLRRSHAAGLVPYLRSVLGRDVPMPSYLGADMLTADRRRPSASENEPVQPVDLLAVVGQALAGQGLLFTSWQIATFVTALQTKPFVILSGISGTGKTKLVQAFARLLPQPLTRKLTSPDDEIQITVQPYMHKYGRLIVPKSATRLFDPPAPGERAEVVLHFGSEEQRCLLVHANYGDGDYLALMFRGKARAWLNAEVSEGDTLRLIPEFDPEAAFTGFRLETGPAEPAGEHTGAEASNCLFLPVRPDWRDSKSLLGYYNPITASYEWTPFLHFVQQAAQSYRNQDGLAWFVILDEMNLAHVEYYFADLLSVMESGRDDEGWTREAVLLNYPEDAEGDLPPRALRLPPNLYVVGTVNVDETTHAFSPKVLDRAFTIELADADFSEYLTDVPASADGLSRAQTQALLETFTGEGEHTGTGYADKTGLRAVLDEHPEFRTRLQTLNVGLKLYDRHFGYRVFDEIVWFLDWSTYTGVYANLGSLDAAFDAAVLMKVLPKFHGSRARLEAPLRFILGWCLDPDIPSEDRIAETLNSVSAGNDDVSAALSGLSYRLPRTAERAIRLLAALYADGFAAFG